MRELKSNHGRVNVNINSVSRWSHRTVVHREAEKITSGEMICKLPVSQVAQAALR
jgi:hypothetical protein